MLSTDFSIICAPNLILILSFNIILGIRVSTFCEILRVSAAPIGSLNDVDQEKLLLMQRESLSPD